MPRPGGLAPIARLRAFLSLATASVIGQLIGFAALIYVTRRVTPAQFGAYNFALAIVAYAALPANLGISVKATGQIAVATPESVRTITREAWASLSLLHVLVFLVLVVLRPFLAPAPLTGQLLTITSLVLLTSALSLDWVLQGLGGFRAIAFARLAGQVGYAVIVFVASARGTSAIHTYAYANIAGYALTSVIVIVSVARTSGLTWPRVAPRRFIARVGAGASIGISLIALQLYVNVPPLMLGALRSASSVASFAIAGKLPFTALSLGAVLNLVIYPSLVRTVNTDRQAVSAELKAIVTAIAIAFLLLLSVAGPNASMVLRGFFGGHYGGAGATFLVLIVAAGIMFVDGTLTCALIALGRERTVTVGILSGGAIQVLLDAILAPRAGALGAAIALCVAELAVLTIFRVGLRRSGTSFAPDWSRIARALAAAAGTWSLSTVYPAHPWLLRLGLSSVSCLLLALGLRVIRGAELSAVASALRRGAPTADD